MPLNDIRQGQRPTGMSFKTKFTLIGFSAVALALIFTILGAFFTVSPGERVVVTRWGAIVGTYESGLNWKIPWITAAHSIDVQDRLIVVDKTEAYSKDQQPADMKVSVRIQVTSPVDVVTRYGTVEEMVRRLVMPRVFQDTKSTFGSFTAATAVSKREELSAAAQKAMQENVGDIVLIKSVAIENIKFDPAYEESIRKRMQAEVEVAKVQQDALREIESAKIANTKADAEAYRVKADATAQAESIKKRGDAEADALRAKGAAIAANPAIIDLIKAEKWNGTATFIPSSAMQVYGPNK